MIIACFYETGIRLSELVGLDVNDVNLVSRQLKVLGKRSKERIIPFASGLCAQFENYLSERAKVAAENESALFLSQKGERVTSSQVYRVVNKRLGEVTSVKKKAPPPRKLHNRL